VSGLILTQLRSDTPLALLLPVFGLFGIGFGMSNAPITFTAVSGMPRAQAGLASAVASTSRQIGISVGVALAGALAGEVGAAHARAAWAGFPQATHAFWWILAWIGVLVFALGWLSTGARAKASTERIAHLLEEPQGGPK
jgi:hypothetical protein